MSSAANNIRNIAIVLVLAALVVLIPGGGQGANIAIQLVSLAFLGGLGWIAYLMYRQHRADLYGLGDTKRATLYIAAAVVALTLTATSRLWSTPGGEIVWFALLVAAVYAGFAVIWSARRY